MRLPRHLRALVVTAPTLALLVGGLLAACLIEPRGLRSGSGSVDAGPDGDGDAEGDAEAVDAGDADGVADADGDIEPDLERDADEDVEADGEADVEADLDAESDGEADVEADLDIESDLDAESDAEADVEADLDVETDVEADLEAEADVEADAETDADGHEIVRVECEDGTLVGAMALVADADAFGGWAVHGPPGTGDFWWDSAAPSLPPSRVEIPVTLTLGGTYHVWVREAAPGSDTDALYAGFDVADLRRFYTSDHGLVWSWIGETSGDPDILIFTGLAPGSHTLIIGPGEEEARCDRVILTTDPTFVPTETP